MLRSVWCIILTFIVFSKAAEAQIRTPKYANEYLAIGVGARGLGMGNVQVSLATDVTASYWNPAGLTQIDTDYQFAIMHAEYFAGIANYDYGGAAFKLNDKSALAVSLVCFAVDDIPDTRFLYDANGAINYDNIRFFSAADYAAFISYAHKLNIEGLHLGGSMKIIHRSAGNFANAWGFGLDAGLYYVKNKLKMGLMARDVTGTFTAWWHNTDLLTDVYLQTGNELPQNSIELSLPRFIYGISRYQTLPGDFGILAAADIEFTFDGQRNTLLSSNFSSVEPRIGMEADYKQLIFLRSGVGQWQQIKRFDASTYWTYRIDFGLGLHWKNFAIDYAMTDLGDQSEGLYSHVFSLKIKVDKKK